MRASLAEALAALPGKPTTQYPEGVPFTVPMANGTMRLVLFAPRGEDRQEPHTQDEIYLVLSGTGTLVVEGEDFPFEAGDALFVAARKEHRFVDFTDDFVTWAVFWGPEGGESA